MELGIYSSIYLTQTHVVMDFGDDPLVSSMYAKVHQNADEMLQPKKSPLIDGIRARNSWYKQSLAQLRDNGVTADMMYAAGMKWPALQAKYGNDALIQHGFTWRLMLQCGFTGRHLPTLSQAQLSLLGVNATRAMECRPTIEQISGLQLTAGELCDMGWTAEYLVTLGLNMHNMVGFGYTLNDWRTALHITDYAALGFTTYAACAAAGWRDGDIRMALAPAQPRPRSGPTGEIRFT